MELARTRSSIAKATLYTKGFSSFSASTTASVVNARSEPVPGWDYFPVALLHTCDLPGKIVFKAKLNSKVIRMKTVAKIGASCPLPFDSVHDVLSRCVQ